MLIEKLRDKGFTDEEARTIFSDSRIVLYPEILGKKGKGLDYFNRKFGLLTRSSLKSGRMTLQCNESLLQDIEDKYHVEKEIIVAIIRVETNFGRYTGNRSVFNSLLTMAILENRRSAWAQEELINLLILSKANGTDPLAVKGSWAGAMGLCQFVPTSCIRYGIDGNNDGAVDLFNMADAMASTANYLKAHGWRKGQPYSKNRDALWAYNHCDSYIKAVFAYARALKKNGRKSPL